jgi:hypothetical protein
MPPGQREQCRRWWQFWPRAGSSITASRVPADGLYRLPLSACTEDK